MEEFTESCFIGRGPDGNQQTLHVKHRQHGLQGQRGLHVPPGMHGGAPPFTPHPIGAAFYLNNGIRLEVKACDVTALGGGAVVAGENNDFGGNGGVAKALLRKGGEMYFEARRKMINEYLDRRPCPDVVLYCPAGDHLPFTFVFHALLTFHTDRGLVTMNSFEQLVDLYGHVLDLARRLNITSIVTPLLGSGASGGQLKDCLQAAFVAISNLKDNAIKTITFVEYDQKKAQVIRKQLKDRIEHLTLTILQRPAPPRLSYTPASDRTSGPPAPDQKTPYSHRGRDKDNKGSPKKHPAFPLLPSRRAAQRVPSDPLPAALNNWPLSPKGWSSLVSPPRVKGTSDAKSPRGTVTEPRGSPVCKKSAASIHRNREEEARRRSGDTSGQRATFDESTKPERGRDIPVGRDLLVEIIGGLNVLKIRDIPIRRVDMEEQHAARMPQPSQLGAGAGRDDLPPQGNVDHNSAKAYLAYMHGASVGYNSNPTPFPQPGLPGMIGDGRGDNSRYSTSIIYPHSNSPGPGVGHGAPLSTFVYQHPGHSPTTGMQGAGQQLAGNQRYSATPTATFSTSTGAGLEQNSVFSRDMQLPQVYPPPARQYSAGAEFPANHNAGGPPPLQYPTSPSSRPPGGYAGSGYPDETGLVTPPPKPHRSQPLGHQENVASTRGDQGGSLGMPQAEQSSLQQPQALRETGSTYNTSGAPRATLEEQSIVRPPNSFGESLPVETPGQWSLLPNVSPNTSLQPQPGVFTLFPSPKQTPLEPQGEQQPILQASHKLPPDYDDKEEENWKEPKVQMPRPAGVDGGGESLPAEKLQSQAVGPGLTRGEVGESPDGARVRLTVTGQIAPSFTFGGHHSSSMEVSDQGRQNPLPPDSLSDFSFARDMRPDTGGHAPGDQPTGNETTFADFWKDPPDWCYVNEEGNSTAYLGPNTDLQDINPDGASHRGMQDYSADNSFQHQPSGTGDFSSFADPPSGSLHQAIPKSEPEVKPKPLPDNEGVKKEPTAAGNADNDADKGTGDSYQGEMKRIFRLPTAYESEEVLAQKIRAKILLEGGNKSPVPTDPGKRKSESGRDRGPEVADSLQEDRPPSTPGGDTDHDADFHFRRQRKSNIQVPGKNAAVSHHRSPSSPDPTLHRGLPLDTTTTVRRDDNTSTTGEQAEDTTTTGKDTKDQEETRETALHTQSSGQDLETEQGHRGQGKGKVGNTRLAAGHSGRDSDSAKPSDKKTLRSIVGTMPTGSMNSSVKQGTQVPGIEDCGVIVVDYDIPDGIQKPEHPQPGSPYRGCVERAFLPDNDEGRRVLKLLEEAFDRRLTFQVCEQPGGQALVEWAGIPHKICLRGTRDRGGYPDPDYLETVRGILREKYGIE